MTARARVSGPMTVSRRTFGTGLAAAALLPARRALAEGYPGSQTIKLMVPIRRAVRPTGSNAWSRRAR